MDGKQILKLYKQLSQTSHTSQVTQTHTYTQTSAVLFTSDQMRGS